MREWIRKTVPGSTAAYEESRLRWKARGTQAQVDTLVATGRSIRLDIGAGDVHRPGWVTLDITDDCDLFWDLRNGIPFPSSSVEIVYSSHLLEHMPYDAGQAVLGKHCACSSPVASSPYVFLMHGSTLMHTLKSHLWLPTTIFGSLR